MTNGYNTPIGVPIGLPSILSLGLPPLVNPYPTLNLDFINNPQFDSRITFSRGSQATLFDSTGTLVYAKHNLALQSQDFTTTWSNTATTDSSNTSVAPDGTTTADTVTEDNTSGFHVVSQGVTAAGVVSLSVFAKLGTGSRYLTIGLSKDASNFGSATFNLSGGTNTQTQANGTYSAASATITAVAQGFYRCTLTVTSDTVASVRIGLNDTSTPTASNRGFGANYTGDNTSSLILWGAQLNIANMEGGVTSSLTTYYPTTTAAYYAPRFDYNPSTLQPRGLLIEEQRTNGIRNNTGQGAVAGTPGTIPTNWATTPNPTASGITRDVAGIGVEDGISYVDFRISGTASAQVDVALRFEALNQIAAASGQTWSFSFYSKLVSGSLSTVTASFFYLIGTNGTSQTETASTITYNPTTASLKSQRFVGTGTLANAATTNVTNTSIIRVPNGATVDFTLRIGLPQLELGAFATSVIPTTTTALTRNADVATMTGTNFSSWYNQTEGTLFSQALTFNSSVSKYPWSVHNGSGAELIASYFLNANGGGFVVDNSSTQVQIEAAGLATLSKIAFAVKTNDFALSINASSVVTDTSGTMPTPDQMQIGNRADGSRNLNGHIQRIAYYPVRLQASQLQALTA